MRDPSAILKTIETDRTHLGVLIALRKQVQDVEVKRFQGLVVKEMESRRLACRGTTVVTGGE